MAIKKAVATSESVNFGDQHSEIYMVNFDLPEGDYVAAKHQVVMHSGFGQSITQRQARLGVMVDFVPLKGEPEVKQVFYGMGSKAHLAFAPDPTGTGIASIPGGTGLLASSSKWVLYRDSLYNCGLPAGVLTNDISVLDGMHIHTQLIPEPKEWAAFASKTATGDAPVEERKAGNVAVVTEILDSGKPWEGTGGIPKTVPTKNGIAKPTPVKTVESSMDEESIKTIGSAALAEALKKNPKGTTKPAIKLAAGKYIKDELFKDEAEAGAEALNACASAWDNDNTLATWLDELEFKLVGPMVKPKA